MENILGRVIDMAEVEDRLEANFRDVFTFRDRASSEAVSVSSISTRR